MFINFNFFGGNYWGGSHRRPFADALVHLIINFEQLMMVNPCNIMQAILIGKIAPDITYLDNMLKLVYYFYKRYDVSKTWDVLLCYKCRGFLNKFIKETYYISDRYDDYYK